MRLIDADELREFFFSETSGTEEIINDLMMKHNLDYLHDVNEDDVMDFAKDLLLAVRNVIDTEPTAEHDARVRADVIEELLKELCIGCAYLNGTKCEIKGGCPCSIGQSEIIRSANKVLEQLKGAENELPSKR